MDKKRTDSEPQLIRASEVATRHGEPPWFERLLDDGRNWVTLICDKPGDSNDPHVHPDFSEWWIVMQGELVWEIGDYPPVHAKKGDIVISPPGQRHLISTVGHEPSLRVAVSKHGSNHDVKGDRASELKPFPDQELPPNLLHTDLARVQAHYGQPDWFQDIVSNDLNRAVLICHGPGMTNEAHWHPAFDEWWPVLKGEVTWEVGSNRPPIHAREGDVVFVPKGMRHLITTVGAGASLRLAVMAPEAVHVYTDDDESAPPPRGLG